MCQILRWEENHLNLHRLGSKIVGAYPELLSAEHLFHMQAPAFFLTVTVSVAIQLPHTEYKFAAVAQNIFNVDKV